MKIFQYLVPVLLATSALSVFAGEKIEKSLSADDVSSVSIENLRGEVTVIGWDKAEVSVKGDLEDDAEKLVFKKDGSDIRIKVIVPHEHRNNWHNNDGSVLTIHVPQSVRVNFDGVSSDISLENLQSSTEAKTVSGQIKAKNLSEHVELMSVSGDIDSHDLSGKIYLSTVSGDINDKNSAGRIQLKAVSGEIDSQSKAKEIFVNNVSGDVELNLAEVDELIISNVSGDSQGRLSLNDNGVVKLSSVSGSVKMKFQQGVEANFRLNANAGGDIVNQITNEKAIRAKYGPSSKLRFETGSASGAVRASTVSGTIKVSN
jgi:DUF4097 and DUF4098 domain-containing protein YvlB